MWESFREGINNILGFSVDGSVDSINIVDTMTDSQKWLKANLILTLNEDYIIGRFLVYYNIYTYA